MWASSLGLECFLWQETFYHASGGGLKHYQPHQLGLAIPLRSIAVGELGRWARVEDSEL
jgi:hypothetical protein